MKCYHIILVISCILFDGLGRCGSFNLLTMNKRIARAGCLVAITLRGICSEGWLLYSCVGKYKLYEKLKWNMASFNIIQKNIPTYKSTPKKHTKIQINPKKN